jgi:hypothetical protein
MAYNMDGKPAAMSDDRIVHFLSDFTLSVMRNPPTPMNSLTISSTNATDFLLVLG